MGFKRGSTVEIADEKTAGSDARGHGCRSGKGLIRDRERAFR